MRRPAANVICGMNWCPREKALPKSSTIGAESTATGALQVEPSVEEETTIWASPLAARWAQAAWMRLTFAASTEAASEGRAFVRNSVVVVAWSNGVIAATWTVFFEGKVLPKSVDLAMTMASPALEVAKRRQAA